MSGNTKSTGKQQKQPLTDEQKSRREALMSILRHSAVFMVVFILVIGDSLLSATVYNGIIYSMVWNMVVGGALFGIGLWIYEKIKED